MRIISITSPRTFEQLHADAIAQLPHGGEFRCTRAEVNVMRAELARVGIPSVAPARICGMRVVVTDRAVLPEVRT